MCRAVLQLILSLSWRSLMRSLIFAASPVSGAARAKTETMTASAARFFIIVDSKLGMALNEIRSRYDIEFSRKRNSRDFHILLRQASQDRPTNPATHPREAG